MTLISAGWNQFGQLGREGDCKIPSPVDFPPSEFICFSVGQLHSILVDKNGDLYGWGSNEDGGLGFANRTEVKKPTKIELNERVVWAACGYCVTAVLTESGRVLIISEGDPVQADIPEPCEYVCCGYYLVWAIGRSGTIYQCSSSPEDPCEKYELPEKTVQMDAGNGFAIAITADGQAFGFGDISPIPSTGKFEVIDSLQNVKVMKASAFEAHCIVISTDGKAYAWGSGGQGRLGLGSYDNSTVFVHVDKFDGKKVVDAAAGLAHSCFVTEDGSIYGCGNNEYGQALIGQIEMQPEPTKSEETKNVTAVECGNHTLAIIGGHPLKKPGIKVGAAAAAAGEHEKTKGVDKENEKEEKKNKSSCCLLI
ncbi:hypothetical protein TRFO_43048 [Tritrichomonas foetus]|uniref:Regulator of chromosome condensation n=1 Tax=Tritrichomonas foetus TaxID=1144522 RepID=A0A1J4KY12_9EUKA|nr:hypothetical protein TRFO_43048 [Tritrichomonas foetus]|eukprot:OHT14453.1 hypothetical protein TRFO_43048 [Tritrichomonas foetus]